MDRYFGRASFFLTTQVEMLLIFLLAYYQTQGGMAMLLSKVLIFLHFSCLHNIINNIFIFLVNR